MVRRFDFLHAPLRPTKVLRTMLYGDQLFHLFELEILHTPAFQRLYDLKQLGFADRVYPDAVHSRFNHILGVAERAQQMIEKVIMWLEDNQSDTYRYWDDRRSQDATLTADELRMHLKNHVRTVRLIGLLHDLTHAAYGHTLEDEVNVFAEKHDDPQRQRRFFDGLAAQLFLAWREELLGVELDMVDELERSVGLHVSRDHAIEHGKNVLEALDAEGREKLLSALSPAALACRLLLSLTSVHEPTAARPEDLAVPLVFEEVLTAYGRTPEVVSSHRDLILLDIVGNTICADLVDYARRDARHAGVRLDFDDRLMRYLRPVSVDGPFAPDKKPSIRLAVQFFTNKMRHDVLSEMSLLLKGRYLLSERVLFHPTKCAAGAMLASAIVLLGVDALPPWMQAMGDQEFTKTLWRAAMHACDVLEGMTDADAGRPEDAVERLLGGGANATMRALLNGLLGSLRSAAPTAREMRHRCLAARHVLWRLCSRRYPKLVYRLRPDIEHSGADTAADVAERYSRRSDRFDMERKIEKACRLETGSVFVHCPRRRTSMKIAEALVVGPDMSQVSVLRTLREAYRNHQSLEPYEQEVRATEEMYASIWQLHVYLDPGSAPKMAIVVQEIEELVGFPNDGLLRDEIGDGEAGSGVYSEVARRRREFAADDLPQVVEKLEEVNRPRPGWTSGLGVPRAKSRE